MLLSRLRERKASHGSHPADSFLATQVAREAAICAFFLLLLLPACAFAQQSRPLLPFEGDPEGLKKAVAGVMALSEDELLRRLTLEPGAAPDAEIMQSVDSLIALRDVPGEQEYGDRALRILITTYAQYLAASDEELRGQITAGGMQDESNRVMRGVAFALAKIYHLTRDPAVARRTAVILARFAEVVPGWPLVDREGELKSQDDPEYLRRWNALGLWGEKVSVYAHSGIPLLRAFDLIYDSGVMQEMGVVEKIERDLIRHMPDYHLKRPVALGNMAYRPMEGLVIFGIGIPEPKYVHIAVQRYRYMMNAPYYADGFWHEGSASYHKQISHHLTGSTLSRLKGYSDPPGYTCDIDLPRYDNLDLVAEYARQHARMAEALNKLSFPDKEYAKIHDSHYPHRAWYDRRTEIKPQPRLLGCMGHAVVGTGDEHRQAEVHLHYSGTHGHEHFDALNIVLWAQGRELISETQYLPMSGDELSTRGWHTCTAGHNTVVIDERNQEARFPDASHQRKITAADAMEAVSQYPGMVIDTPNWCYRAYGQGNSLNDGKLRCFCPDWDPVQVVEAEAERSYYPDPQLYRRTLVMVHAGPESVYVVDIFRVRGGTTHDWMLHGCLQKPYELRTSLDLKPKEDSLHTYLEQLRAAATDAGWTADFIYPSGAHLRTHILGAAGTTVIVGRGPSMRRANEYAQFLDVRRQTGESCFVAVHDPYHPEQGGPGVLGIEPVPWGNDPMAVGLLVHLASGDTDLILSSPDDPPFQRRDTTEGISFAGRLAHIRFKDDQLVHAYGVDAGYLKVGELELTGPGYYAGEIIATHRVEVGAEFDAFETNALLPPGLEGRCLVVDLGGQLTQAYVIDRVEQTEGGALIYSRDEPGLEIRWELIKMMYYPGWGIPRPCRFHIADTLLWQAGDAQHRGAHLFPAPGDRPN